jgi:hypothetical protein
MIPKIISAREALTEQDILKVEFNLNSDLPISYKNFLLNQNGGHPQPDSFPIQDKSWDDYGQIDYFLCIDENDTYNLSSWVNRYQKRLPFGLIPIAVDPGGNLVCLAISGNETEKVFLWDHENEAGDGEQPSQENIHLISNSFTEFIGSFM